MSGSVDNWPGWGRMLRAGCVVACWRALLSVVGITGDRRLRDACQAVGLLGRLR